MRHYAGLFESINAGQAQHRARPQGQRRPGPGARAGRGGRRARRGLPARRDGPARARRRPRARRRTRRSSTAPSPATGRTIRAPRCRATTSTTRRGRAHWRPKAAPASDPAAADRPTWPAGMTAAFGDLRRRPGPGHERRGDVPRHLDDRRAGHLDRAASGARDARQRRRPVAEPARSRATGSSTTADGGQIALGVINEQHFWSSLCAELGLDELAALDFDDRSARGAELQQAVGRGHRRASAVTTWSPRSRRRRARRSGARPQGMLAERAIPSPSRSGSRSRRRTGPSRPSTNTAARVSRAAMTRARRASWPAEPTSGANAAPRHAQRRRSRPGRTWPSSPAWTPASTSSPCSGLAPRRGPRHPQRRRARHRRRAPQPRPLERRARGRHRCRHAAHEVRPRGGDRRRTARAAPAPTWTSSRSTTTRPPCGRTSSACRARPTSPQLRTIARVRLRRRQRAGRGRRPLGATRLRAAGYPRCRVSRPSTSSSAGPTVRHRTGGAALNRSDRSARCRLKDRARRDRRRPDADGSRLRRRLARCAGRRARDLVACARGRRTGHGRGRLPGQSGPAGQLRQRRLLRARGRPPAERSSRRHGLDPGRPGLLDGRERRRHLQLRRRRLLRVGRRASR